MFHYNVSLTPSLLLGFLLTSVAGYYHGGEIHTKESFYEQGVCTKVQWRARPAVGNCVISLMSIFNADQVFGGGSPPAWSEVGFEVFGGSADNNEKTYQTQYITETSPGQNKKQHYIEHYTDVFDGKFHTFEINFCPANSGGTGGWVRWKIDGKKIRTESGGDVNLLQPNLDIYAAVWMRNWGNSWACTGDDSQPKQTAMPIDWIKVTGGSTKTWNFNSNNELNNDWQKSDWGFSGFDGVYVPGNAYVTSHDGRAVLKLAEV